MTTVQFSYQLTGTIEVPEGSQINPAGTGIILPDGKTLKLWEAWEAHHTGDDDHIDLTYADLAELGIHYDTMTTAFEEI